MRKVMFALLLSFTLLSGRATPAHADGGDVALRAFFPASDYTGAERRYSVAATEKIQRAKLIFVEDASGARLYENMPMLIEGGVFATTQAELTLPAEGDYRFRIGLSKIDRDIVDASGNATEDRQTFFFTVTVRSKASRGALKNVKLSRPPYYVDHSFEIETLFDTPPVSVDAGLRVGNAYQAIDVVHNSGGLAVVGYATPTVKGDQAVVVAFQDPASGTVYQEEIPIYVDVYDRGGETVVKGKGGSGGCDALASGVLLCACSFCLLRRWRR